MLDISMSEEIVGMTRREEIRMADEKDRVVESIRKRWDEHAEGWDKWYETFEGAVQHHVEWELLKGYLPQNKDAKILDGGGGTGRITLPLAKRGYSVTLCDISPRMLDVARQKMVREGVSDKVEILECDVCKLRFADESFDFVICWDGAFEAAKELIRVTKKRGKISIYQTNKWGAAIDKFYKDPASTLALIESTPSYVKDGEETYRVVSEDEARKLFEAEGIRVIDVYAVWGWMNVLSIPEKIRESRSWDEKFFKQTTKILLRLSKEPSIKGISRHLVLYGEKT
jgi:ubiquinone/menaquinone biosynthesis C-methylase UbiE